MGIEPTSSAWKAEVLPLNYTRKIDPTLAAAAGVGARAGVSENYAWWRGQDSNLRRLSRQIYSLLPLTAWVPLRAQSAQLSSLTGVVSTDSGGAVTAARRPAVQVSG